MGQGLAFPDRNTPTSVGKTSGGSCLRVRSEKHPHERGEDGRAHDRSGQLLETPPRAWGRRPPCRRTTLDIRNTPTSVGKTGIGQQLAEGRRKHPHERGEDGAGWRSCDHEAETPPRAWGRQQFFDERHAHIRNTPTSVGKTVLRKLLLMLIRKHPHERGED